MSHVVRRHLVAVVAVLFAAMVVFRGGLIVNAPVELALLLLLYLMPYLANRAQHLHLSPLRAPLRTNDVETPVRPAKEIRAITYNLFMRPGIVWIRNNESDHKDVRLEAFLRHLDRFDIVAVQELFGLLSFRQRRLILEAERRGFCHAAVAGAPTYLFWDRHWSFKIPFLDAGLVTLSRHPILKTDSHYYRLGNQIDGWAPKQVLWALIQLPGEANLLHVFNTHMQASYYDAPSGVSDMARAKQVTELAMFVKEKVYGGSGPRYPALICGDFNLDAIDARHQGPHSLDYVRMMDILARELNSPSDGFVIRDLALESLGYHPITYGDVAEGLVLSNYFFCAI